MPPIPPHPAAPAAAHTLPQQHTPPLPLRPSSFLRRFRAAAPPASAPSSSQWTPADISAFIGGSIVVGITVAVALTQLWLHSRRGGPKTALRTLYCRIIVLAPLYSCTALISFAIPRWAGLFGGLRGFYEAYALLCFFALMTLAAGGERYVTRGRYSGVGVGKGWRCQICCPPFRDTGCLSFTLTRLRDPRCAFNAWRRMIFQFMIIKPISSAVVFVLEHKGLLMKYDPYIKVVNICSVTVATVAVICLLVELAPSIHKLRAEAKFVVLKLAVFLTVWQEAIFNILIEKKIITSPYCLAAGHSEEHCLKLAGFGTAQAMKGVRTISCLVMIEMLALGLLCWRFYSYDDPALLDDDDDATGTNSGDSSGSSGSGGSGGSAEEATSSGASAGAAETGAEKKDGHDNDGGPIVESAAYGATKSLLPKAKKQARRVAWSSCCSDCFMIWDILCGPLEDGSRIDRFDGLKYQPISDEPASV